MVSSQCSAIFSDAPPSRCTTTRRPAMPSIAIFVTWKQLGLYILLYLAAWLLARTDLDDYKRVRKEHGGTVNDVVLAVVQSHDAEGLAQGAPHGAGPLPGPDRVAAECDGS